MISAQKKLEDSISTKFQSLSQTSVAESTVHHSASLYLQIGLVTGAISSVLMIAYTKKQAKMPVKPPGFTRLKQEDEEFNQIEKLC